MDLDFSLKGTGIVVLFGRSGAGKTTLTGMIAGLVTPDEGRIACGGRVFFDSSAGIDLPPERRGLGCVFQQHRLFSHMSVRNNLLFAPRFCNRPYDGAFFDRVVELLGIGHLLPRRPNTLSGGEGQRVAIGRALLCHASLLLMDEPLSSLDNERKEDLAEYVASIPGRFGVPILYVTHSLGELSRLADTVLEIDGGRAAAPCARDAFLERYRPERAGQTALVPLDFGRQVEYLLYF